MLDSAIVNSWTMFKQLGQENTTILSPADSGMPAYRLYLVKISSLMKPRSARVDSLDSDESTRLDNDVIAKSSCGKLINGVPLLAADAKAPAMIAHLWIVI